MVFITWGPHLRAGGTLICVIPVEAGIYFSKLFWYFSFRKVDPARLRGDDIGYNGGCSANFPPLAQISSPKVWGIV